MVTFLIHGHLPVLTFKVTIWVVTHPADAVEALTFCSKSFVPGFQDREPVSKHLPLAWSHSTEAEDQKLMTVLEELSDKFKA